MTVLALLAACGGGSDAGSNNNSNNNSNNSDNNSSSNGTAPQPSAYPFVPPRTSSIDTYTDTVTDVNGNRVAFQLRSETAVEPDRTYSIAMSSPAVVLGDQRYHRPDQIDIFDASGRLVDTRVTNADGTQSTCTRVANFTHTGQGGTPGYNLGETWSGSFTVTCNALTVTYTQHGEVLAAEPVTVAAGTFDAVKVQTITSWTTQDGDAITDTSLAWKDPAHSLYPIKVVDNFARSGNVPTEYVTVETRELQSRVAEGVGAGQPVTTTR
jgi:hypothetical protein